MNAFNGIGTGMSNLWQLSDAKTRSICPENPNGGKGAGGMCEVEDGSAKEAAHKLGKGWKVNPYYILKPGQTCIIAEIEGPGCIQHIWLTPQFKTDIRNQILRVYWDECELPSVECPVGDFFACGYGEYSQISTLPICVNPARAFNSYWPMPFLRRCRMTYQNNCEYNVVLFYQIDYCLTEVPNDAAYFHAQFRRKNPLPYKENYTIVDNIRGKGHFVGTYMCWGTNNNCWWGEGEIKFYMDGDTEYPTICGTGTEDYFCGSYDFVDHFAGKYVEFTTPYSGIQLIRTDDLFRSQKRFGLYRFHVADPIRFESDLRVTIQALGWRADGRYQPLKDDLSSVAYWYQTLPFTMVPQLPDAEDIEIV